MAKANNTYEICQRDGEVLLTAYHGHYKRVEIPDEVTVIGMSAFRRCFSMEELVIPPSVTVIEAEAFNGCYGLKQIHFSEGLRQIRHRAFWCCSAIREISFPRSLRQIGSRAFECCSMLRQVHFGNAATEIDEYAFNETPYFEKKLREAAIIMQQSRRKSRSLAGNGAGSDRQGLNYYNDHGDASVKLDHFTDLVLPEGVTHIDHWAYHSSLIENLVLPNSLRTLGMCAFKDCKSLKKVSMSPNTYCNYKLRLGPSDGIFSGCSSLEEVTLRGPLKSFTWYDAQAPEILHGFDRERTFLHCPSMQRLTAWEIPLNMIPDEWKQYAINAFLADPSRDEHYLPEIAAEYHDRLFSFRSQLIRRTGLDQSFALYQYLTDHDMITEDEIDTLISQAGQCKDPEIIALLLQYKKKKFASNSFAGSLLDAIGEL